MAWERRKIAGTLLGRMLGVTRQAVYEHGDDGLPGWMRQRIRCVYGWTRTGDQAKKFPLDAIKLRGQERLIKFARGLVDMLMLESIEDDKNPQRKPRVPSLERLAWLFGTQLKKNDYLEAVVVRAIGAVLTELHREIDKIISLAQSKGRQLNSLISTGKVRAILDKVIPCLRLNPASKAALDAINAPARAKKEARLAEMRAELDQHDPFWYVDTNDVEKAWKNWQAEIVTKRLKAERDAVESRLFLESLGLA